METKAERLRWAREHAPYKSAADFARTHGFSEVTYRAHENGTRQLTEAAARAYAPNLDVTWAWLLTGVTAGDSRSAHSSDHESRENVISDNNAQRSSPSTTTRGTRPTRSHSGALPAKAEDQQHGPAGSLEIQKASSYITLGQADLPVHGYARGGSDGFFLNNGMVEGYVARPEVLANNPDAYCVIVHNDSMEPVFAHGHLLYIDPRRSISSDDDIVIELADGQAFVKRLVVRRGGNVTVRQFNPEREIVFKESEVRLMHLVVGSLRVRI